MATRQGDRGRKRARGSHAGAIRLDDDLRAAFSVSGSATEWLAYLARCRADWDSPDFADDLARSVPLNSPVVHAAQVAEQEVDEWLDEVECNREIAVDNEARAGLDADVVEQNANVLFESHYGYPYPTQIRARLLDETMARVLDSTPNTDTGCITARLREYLEPMLWSNRRTTKRDVAARDRCIEDVAKEACVVQRLYLDGKPLTDSRGWQLWGRYVDLPPEELLFWWVDRLQRRLNQKHWRSSSQTRRQTTEPRRESPELAVAVVVFTRRHCLGARGRTAYHDRVDWAAQRMPLNRTLIRVLGHSATTDAQVTAPGAGRRRGLAKPRARLVPAAATQKASRRVKETQVRASTRGTDRQR